MMSETPPVGARAASTTSRLPYPFWLLFSLGALACLLWLAAILLDLWLPVSRLTSPWTRGGLRYALALVVPAFILLAVRSPCLPVRRHAQAYFMVEALLMAIVALPALLPYPTPSDLFAMSSLPLRVPTLSLGVALATVDPLVVARWRPSQGQADAEQQGYKAPDALSAVVAGVGFGVTLLAAAFVALQLLTSSSSCTGNALGCGAIINTLSGTVFGSALACVVVGLFGAWMGYVLGVLVADRA